MKLSVSLFLFVLIFAVILQSGCNNTIGVESQRFPVILFSKTYSATDVIDVQPTADSGYIALGEIFNKNQSMDLILFKTDSEGNAYWSKKFNSFYNMALRVLETNDGYVILSSKSLPSPTYYHNITIFKTDKNGNELWSKTYTDTIPNDVLTTIEKAIDGGFVIAFSKQSINNVYFHEKIILKISETGDVIWRKIVYTDNYSNKPFIIRSNDDGYFILSKINNSTVSDSILTMNIDLSGNSIWQKKYSSRFLPTSLIALHDGSFMASGIIAPGSENYAGLMEINSNGEIEWTKSYQGKSYQSGIFDRFYSVVETKDGNVIAVGHTNRSEKTSVEHAWIMQADQNGNEIWSYIIPGNSGDLLYSVKRIRDNLYIASGMNYSLAYPNDTAWLLNFDLTPCEQWVKKK